MSPSDALPDARQQREHIMTTALREWDPEAELHWEADSGRLSINTTLSAERVSAILAELGEPVSQCGDETVEGGDNCCGCCG